MSAPLHHFLGGLYLDGHKELSNGLPTLRCSLPPRVVLPLQQHIGEPAEPVVAVGSPVLKGQVVARPHGYVSAPVHASTSGRVVAIGDFPVPHPSGLCAPCIVIEPDGEDRWCELDPLADPAAADPEELRRRVREAGIVGLGGAGFPTSIKLSPGPSRNIETLILNGAECEPYITCDDRLMRERPGEVVAGARLLRHLLSAGRCLIGVEDNKPEALAALQEAAGPEVEVVAIPTRYPAGGERQLVQTLTGQEVPSHGLPGDIGVVVQNVATAAAVHRALQHGEPLVSRYVTVTGDALCDPRNMEVPIGTPVSHLLAQRGVRQVELQALILGGSMMGFALHDPETPITKTSNCIVARAAGVPVPPAQPCIRCAACAEVCPARLLPQQLYWYARARDFDRVQDYHLFDCIECGCCAYVCPSHIPLVQYYRYAKTEIWALEKDRQKADLARRRHQAREERQAREAAAREEQRRQKKLAVAVRAGEETQDPKKAAITAALERVRARQQSREGTADAGQRREP